MPGLSAVELKQLSSLLDRALALEHAEREPWLDALGGEEARLAPRLRQLLQVSASDAGAQALDRGAVPPAETTPPHSDYATGDTVGPYRLKHRLGCGGMGEVWLAERNDAHLQRDVALKLPMPLPGHRAFWLRRFERERDILAALEHPHIARLYDAGVSDLGQPYLAMEHVAGEPIDIYCRNRSLSVHDTLQLLMQVAAAVGYAHGRLVLHRDLKPGNVLVTAEGQVRLLDFGTAKLMEQDRAEETALTRAVGRSLTLGYASPEQIRGEPLSTASDVYSLGVLAYELLAGTRPYALSHGTPQELSRDLSAVEVPRASGQAADVERGRQLRGNLDAILAMALHQDPMQRYGSVEALARDWRAHLEGLRVQARTEGWAARVVRHARRHRGPAASVLASMLALGIGWGLGPAALVIGGLSAGLGAALWQARRAARDRDRALALADRNDAVQLFVDLLINKAARSGAPITALQLLERSQQLAEQELADQPEPRAMVLAMIGTSLNMSGHASRAEQLLGRACEAARSSGDRDLYEHVRCHHAMSLVSCGRVDEAMAILQPIVRRAGGQPDVLTYAHYYLGEQAKARGDARALMHHATEGLRWMRRARHSARRQEDTLQALLGFACHLQGRNDEAEHHYRQVLERLESKGLAASPNAEAHLFNWAVIKLDIGDFDAALGLFERSLDLGSRAAAQSLQSPMDWGGKARALQLLGRLDEADAAYRECLRLARLQGIGRMIYFARVGQASIALQRGMPEQARQELEAADLERAVPVHEGSASAHLRRLTDADLSLARGVPEPAVALYGSIIEQSLPVTSTVLALIGRARAQAEVGRHDAAAADAARALDLARELQGRRASSPLVDLVRRETP